MIDNYNIFYKNYKLNFGKKLIANNFLNIGTYSNTFFFLVFELYLNLNT